MRQILCLLFILTLPALSQELPSTKFYGKLGGENVVVSISAHNGSLTGSYSYPAYPNGERPQIVGRLKNDMTFTAEVGDDSGRPKEVWTGRLEFGHVTNMIGTWSNAVYGTSGKFQFCDDPDFRGD